MTDPTPTTPVTIRDEMLISLGKLQGANTRDLTQIYNAVAGLAGDIETIKTTLADHTERLDRLQEGVGATPYQLLTLTTVRGLLFAMLGRLTTLAFGTAPVAGGDHVSDGDLFEGGRRYAIFPNDIPGVTISSDRKDLTNSNWSGWSYYIQTTDPEPWINGIPTQPNGWLGLGVFATVNFSVETQYPITVYLKRPPAFEGFYIWSHDDGELEAWSASGLTRYGPITSKYPDLSWNTNASGFRYLLGSDWGGWQWESAITSFSAVYGNNALSTVVSSATGIVPAGNNWLYLAFENAPSTGWYIKLTPPEPS